MNYELSKNLKKYRAINELTQQEVADKLGVDRTTYSKYESGKATPHFDNIIRLSEIYEISLGELCGRTFEETIDLADVKGFNTEEVRFIYKFRKLSDRRKQEILRVTARLSNDQAKENDKNEKK